MPTYWFDATDSNAHPDDPSELYDSPDADALADAEKVRPVTRDAPEPEGDVPAPLGGDAADMIERGVCPWCSEYEGDHVGRHASSAHAEKWNEYSTD